MNKRDKKRFVVIDGNHLIHRAYHAIQNPLKTSSGEQTNAIYGFASMLINIIEIEKPDYIAMTFDEHAPTFRHEMHEEYKGTRVKAPDELYAQIPRIKEMVEAFKMPIYSKEGFEADDMLGTLAKEAEEQGMEVYIVTGDMDVMQLITPNIRVAYPHKGYREPIIFDRQRVKEKYGIEPEQVADYKALMGDTSDNIKGVQGIGPKGAVQLLNEYGSLDGIYKHIDNIKGGLHDKLVAGKENAYFSQKMTQIVTDVPNGFKKEDTDLEELDYMGLDCFFEEMEMKSLRGRLKKIIPEKKQQPEAQMSLF
ncbi:MAG: 5'-3' exonuclease H3TH domain-containing protein [Patescibacteria group bacterium]